MDQQSQLLVMETLKLLLFFSTECPTCSQPIKQLTLHWQITKAKNHNITFVVTHCVFQDWITRKTIGFAKKSNGLYYLEETKGDIDGQNELLLYPPDNTSIFSKRFKIWLHHLRISLPSFHLLKTMFPLLFETFPLVIYSLMYVFAKHHYVSFI